MRGEAEEGGLAPGSWPAGPPPGRGWTGSGASSQAEAAGHGVGSHSRWRVSLLSETLVSGSFSFLNPDLALLSALSAPASRGQDSEACLGSGFKPYLFLGYRNPTHSRGKLQRSEKRTPPKHRPPSPPHRRGQGKLSTIGRGWGQEGGRGIGPPAPAFG